MSKTKKIHICEDNEKNLELFKAVLGTIPNLSILTSMTGEECLQQMKTNPVDVIILDIQLPDMSGIDVCRELRKEGIHKNTPIIAVTSFAMKGDEGRILEAKFTDYVSKPILIKEFRAMILKYLDGFPPPIGRL